MGATTTTKVTLSRSRWRSSLLDEVVMASAARSYDIVRPQRPTTNCLLELGGRGGFTGGVFRGTNFGLTAHTTAPFGTGFLLHRELIGGGAVGPAACTASRRNPRSGAVKRRRGSQPPRRGRRIAACQAVSRTVLNASTASRRLRSHRIRVGKRHSGDRDTRRRHECGCQTLGQFFKFFALNHMQAINRSVFWLGSKHGRAQSILTSSTRGCGGAWSRQNASFRSWGRTSTT